MIVIQDDMNRGTAAPGSLLGSSSIGSSSRSSSAAPFRTATVESEISAGDKAAFQQLLIDIQTAWSKQDLAALRRFVTPEMLAYFSTALAEQASQEVENHVEDVVLTKADLEESWTEEGTDYAAAKLQWTARDYTVSTSKQPGQPGYLIEGSDQSPTDTTELWTFMVRADCPCSSLALALMPARNTNSAFPLFPDATARNKSCSE